MTKISVRKVLALAFAAAALAQPAHAELVIVKSEAGFGMGLAVRREGKCLVVTPAHVARGRITSISGGGRSTATGEILKSFDNPAGRAQDLIDVDLALIEVHPDPSFSCTDELPTPQEIAKEIRGADSVFVKRLTQASGTTTSRFFVSSAGTELMQLRPMDADQDIAKGDSGSIIYSNRVPLAMVLRTSSGPRAPGSAAGSGGTTALRFDVIEQLVDNYLASLQGDAKTAVVSALSISYNPISVLGNPFYRLSAVDGASMPSQQAVIADSLADELRQTALFSNVSAGSDQAGRPTHVFRATARIEPNNGVSYMQCMYVATNGHTQFQALSNRWTCPTNWQTIIRLGYSVQIEAQLTDRKLGKDLVQRDNFNVAIDYRGQSIVSDMNTVVASHTCVLFKQALRDDGNPKLKISRGASAAAMALTLPVNILGALLKEQNSTTHQNLC